MKPWANDDSYWDAVSILVRPLQRAWKEVSA